MSHSFPAHFWAWKSIIIRVHVSITGIFSGGAIRATVVNLAIPSVINFSSKNCARPNLNSLNLSKSLKLLSFRTKIKIVRFCLKLVSQFPIRMPAMYHRPIIFNIQKYLDIAFGVSWLLFVKSKPLKVEL